MRLFGIGPGFLGSVPVLLGDGSVLAYHIDGDGWRVTRDGRTDGLHDATASAVSRRGARRVSHDWGRGGREEPCEERSGGTCALAEYADNAAVTAGSFSPDGSLVPRGTSGATAVRGISRSAETMSGGFLPSGRVTRLGSARLLWTTMGNTLPLAMTAEPWRHGPSHRFDL